MNVDPAEGLTAEALEASDRAARARAREPVAEPVAAAEPPEWAERQLLMLRELSDMGMQIARALTRQVLEQAQASEEAAAPNRPAAADPGLSFSRISRAVRLTFALEARLERQIEGWGQARGAANDDDDEAPRAEHDWRYDQLAAKLRKAVRGGNDYEIRRAVEETIEAAHTDEADVERLKEELRERLDEDEVFLYRASWPIGEAIDLICQDLGLTPDWDRWRNTKWARKEAAESPRCSPYATIIRPPLMANRHPRTGTETYRRARGLPVDDPPPAGSYKDW